MYLENNDVVSAQMSKVHSWSTLTMVVLHVVNYYPSNYIPWQNDINFGESKTNGSTFDVLSSAHQLGRWLCTNAAIGHDSGLVSWLLNCDV